MKATRTSAAQYVLPAALLLLWVDGCFAQGPKGDPSPVDDDVRSALWVPAPAGHRWRRQTGPRGEPGTTGPAGQRGPSGPTGQRGPTGPAGPRVPGGPGRESDPTGPTGQRGPDGPATKLGPRTPVIIPKAWDPNDDKCPCQKGDMGLPGLNGLRGEPGPSVVLYSSVQEMTSSHGTHHDVGQLAVVMTSPKPSLWVKVAAVGGSWLQIVP